MSDMGTALETQTIRAAAARDPHRPRYHLVPPPSWINDPKPFFWDGVYHVFFQYCPGVPYSARKHWGHAVSRDLARWRELPVALAPTPGGPDAGGCWTGCVVEDRGRFHILYTGVPHLTRPHFDQVQCLATSADLVTWEKYAGNPVIPASQKPRGFGDTFRDPQAWREEDAWYCIIGGNLPEGDDQFKHGAPFLYRSPDLIHWEYLHPLYVGPAARDECPDFYPLDGPRGRKWVLLSSRRETAWAIGDYADHRFTPETTGTADDRLYYAAKTLLDDGGSGVGRGAQPGRRILFGWVREDRPREAYVAAGWSGTFALPRVLSILPDGTLGQEPVPELEALRGARRGFGSFALGPGKDEIALEVPGGDCSEVLVRFAPNEAKAFGLAVQGSDEILYDRERQALAGRPLSLGPDDALTVRVFVDRSVIEVFAHGRVCKTLRTYHQPGDNLDVIRLLARGGTATVESLDVWEMGSFEGAGVA
jgi:beta-fructofuranosidase